MTTGVFIAVAVVGLFWLGFRHPRPRRWLLPRRVVARVPVSAVDRQHRHLLAGGRLGETAVSATEAHFRELLDAGRASEVERALRPGVDFVVQVQALAAIGTPEAGRVLERQLARPLSRDPNEQAWYWADVASGLRRLAHTPALPAVLRCADSAAGTAAGTVLASEVVAFPNFPCALADLSSPVGRAALRAVTMVSRGCRDGAIDPAEMLRAGLGETLAMVCETAPPTPNPWLAAALLEAERLFRRVGHWARLLPDATAYAERQRMLLWSSAGRRADWLTGAPDRLIVRFPVAPPDEQTAILRFLFETRADVAILFPHPPNRRAAWRADAIRCLTWSRSATAGTLLTAQAERRLAAPLLSALRGHPGPAAERLLLAGARVGDPELRRAAAAALGWWPPINSAAVLQHLRESLTDDDPATRRAALAALARLGERAALAELTRGLSSEEPAIRAGTAMLIADAELTWLWPDLQDMADSEDPETALPCCEALERLREHLLGPLG
jgi:hypothetical protein